MNDFTTKLIRDIIEMAIRVQPPIDRFFMTGIIVILRANR